MDPQKISTASYELARTMVLAYMNKNYVRRRSVRSLASLFWGRMQRGGSLS